MLKWEQPEANNGCNKYMGEKRLRFFIGSSSKCPFFGTCLQIQTIQPSEVDNLGEQRIQDLLANKKQKHFPKLYPSKHLIIYS